MEHPPEMLFVMHLNISNWDDYFSLNVLLINIKQRKTTKCCFEMKNIYS